MTTYYMSDFMKSEVLLDSVSMADVGVDINHSTFRKSKKRFKFTHYIPDCVTSYAFPLYWYLWNVFNLSYALIWYHMIIKWIHVFIIKRIILHLVKKQPFQQNSTSVLPKELCKIIIYGANRQVAAFSSPFSLIHLKHIFNYIIPL